MIGNEPSGQWMMNSAVDNPNFLVKQLTNFFGSVPKDTQASSEQHETAQFSSYSEMKTSDIPDEGALKFESRCSACHTVGGGDSVGPDLANVTARRDRAWLVNYILEPDRMLSQHDPIAMTLFGRYKSVRMPNLNLTPEDTEKVIKYIQDQSKVAGQHASSDAHH
jgi:protein SCO1/2